MLLVLTAVGSTLPLDDCRGERDDVLALDVATGEQLFGEPKPRWLFPESDATWLQSSAVLGDYFDERRDRGLLLAPGAVVVHARGQLVAFG